MSPHLDDGVFSVGGVLARLGDEGWDVRLVTCFTASVPSPTGFALSTQLDKGLPPDADYMALRRDEDRAAAAELGATPVHLPLPEAPHRGYGSAAELFAGRRADDDVARDLAPLLAPEVAAADLVLAPQALGDHVDHQVVATVVAGLAAPGVVAWWRDVPYVRRDPAAGSATLALDVTSVLGRKVRAARCYRTQTGFQFGGGAGVGPALWTIAVDEGARVGAGFPAEAVTAGDVATSRLPGR